MANLRGGVWDYMRSQGWEEKDADTTKKEEKEKKQKEQQYSGGVWDYMRQKGWGRPESQSDKTEPKKDFLSRKAEYDALMNSKNSSSTAAAAMLQERAKGFGSDDPKSRRAFYQEQTGKIADIDKRLEEIQAQKDAEFVRRETGLPPEKDSDTKLGAAYSEKELRALKQEREQLAAAVTAYERQQKAMDDAWDVSNKPGFNKTQVPERESWLNEYHNARDAVKERAVGQEMYSRGRVSIPGIERGQGEATGENAEPLMRQKTERNDRLSIYRLADGADRERAMAQEMSGQILDPALSPLGQAYSMTQEEADRARIVRQGDERGWDKLTENELQVYYYLLEHAGQDSADSWLDGMTNELQRRQTESLYELPEDAGVMARVGVNAATVGMNFLGSIAAGKEDLGKIVTGQEINPYSAAHALQNVTGKIRSQTAKEIEDAIDPEKHPLLAQTASNTYQAIMSGLDSAMGATLTGGYGYDIIMGLGAGSQRAKELWEQGASREQIALGAIGSGALEAFFEHVSLEKFATNFLENPIDPDLSTAKKIGQFLKKVAVQGGVEASEEVFTELGNMVLDAINRGSMSDNSQRVREYVEKDGKSEKEALKLAAWDAAKDIFWAGYGGFISGGGMGLVGGGTNMVLDHMHQVGSERAAGRQIIQNQSGAKVMEDAKAAGVDQKLMELAKESAAMKMEQYKKLSGRQKNTAAQSIGRVYDRTLRNQVNAANNAQQATVQERTEAALKEQGMENAAKAAEVIAKKDSGEKLTKAEQKLYSQVKGDEVLNAVKADTEGLRQEVQQRAEKAGEALFQTMDKASPDYALAPENVAKAKELVAEQADGYGDYAEDFKNTYQDGQDVESYTRAWDDAFRAGEQGMAERYALESVDTQYLTAEQKKAAYEAGRKAGAAYEAENGVRTGSEWNDRADSGRQGTAVEGSPEQGAAGQGAESGAGKTAVGQVSTKELGISNGTENKSLRIRTEDRYNARDKKAAKVAKEHGLKLVLVEGGPLERTEVRNGEKKTVLARAMIEGDTIYVRADDQIMNSYQLARHEAAHKQIANKEISMDAAKKYLLKNYTTAQLQRMIDTYAAAYAGSGMDAEEAFEEIICDAMGEMNEFAAKAGELASGMGQFLRNVQTAAKETAGKGAKAEARTEVKNSREMDTKYLEAVRNGDMQTAQKMVDEAAKAAGYSERMWHGAKKGGGFTVFRGWSYFTKNEAYARRYMDQANRGNDKSLYSVYVDLGKAFDTRKSKERRLFNKARMELGMGEIGERGLPDWTDGYDLSDYIDENELDYDSIVLDEGGDMVNGKPVHRGESYVVRNSASVKYADPVTYDDSGNVIPLSERFNSKQDDIRYSREMDTKYLEAVRNGDMQTAQKMVDEAAEEEMPESQFRMDEDGDFDPYGEKLIAAYHATDSDFNAFSKRKLGWNTDVTASDPYIAATAHVGFWFNKANLADKLYMDTKKTKRVYLNAERIYETSLYEMADEIMNMFDGEEKTPAQMGRAYREKLIWDGYDGIYVKDQEFGTDSFVVFESSQAKLADAVTKTDKGNVIPLSKRFNTEKRDIRYSREMQNEKKLQERIKYLEKKAEYWKGQTQISKEKTAMKEDVCRAARELVRAYNSKTSVDTVAKELQAVANYLVNTDELDFNVLRENCENVADLILRGSMVNSRAETENDYKEIRSFLMANPIEIPKTAFGDIADFKDFKERNRYRMRLKVSGGTAMESMWMELQDRFGKGMFPEDIQNPVDQLQKLEELLDGLEPVYENPYGQSLPAVIKDVGNDILNTVLSDQIRQTPKTKADKLAEESRDAKAVYNARLEQEIGEVRRRERGWMERRNSSETRRKIRGLTDKMRRMAEHPGKADTQHVPPEMLRSLLDFCEIVNASEIRRNYRWSEDLTKRLKDNRERMELEGEWYSLRTESEQQKLERAVDRNARAIVKLEELKAQYAKMKDDGKLVGAYDETVAGMLNSLNEKLAQQLQKGDIWQLSNDDLTEVYNTMQGIMTTVTKANQARTIDNERKVSEITRSWADQIKQVNPKTPGYQTAWLRYRMWQMSPDNFFSFISGYIKDNEGKKVQQAFAKGGQRMLEVQREFWEMFRDFTETKDKAREKELKNLMQNQTKNMVDWGLKNADGDAVKTSRGMMMQAYMLLIQPDSYESLLHGGFRLPNAQVYYQGKVKESYGDADLGQLLSETDGESYIQTVREMQEIRKRLDEIWEQYGQNGESTEEVQEETRQASETLRKRLRELQEQEDVLNTGAEARLNSMIESIWEQLTTQEKQLMARAHEWYAHSGQLMSECFERMYGFRPLLAENYVPIHRDLNSVQVDIRTSQDAEKAFNLENSGFTKERVRSRAPILLTDFFTELTGQKDRMSRYVGFVEVQKDFNKIWKTQVGSTNINGLVVSRFGAGDTKFGVSGETYINNYIRDVAGGSREENVLDKFYGNAMAATLRLNPRVAVSQAASIPTAAAVVGWKSMAVGFAKGVRYSVSADAKNTVAEKNAWFYQRYRGEGTMAEFNDLMKKGGIIEKAANSKVGKVLFNWCQAVDVFSTGPIMWSMAEDYVQRQGVKKGSEGYEAAVNQVYTDIIRKSQPNYTTTERSDLLRDKRGGMKFLTMYKTQSNQNLNILMDANGEFQRMRQDLKNGRNGVTQADVDAARKKLTNAMTSVLLGGTVFFVAMRTLMNFFMGMVNPYKDKDTDEVTVAVTAKGVAKEIGSSLAGIVAFGGPAYDIIMAYVNGENYYGLSDTGIANVSGALENTLKVAQSWKAGKQPTGKQVRKMFESLGSTMGIPVANLLKLGDMVEHYFDGFSDKYPGFWDSEDTSKKNYRNRLFQGWQEGDMEKVDSTVAYLMAQSDEDTDEKMKNKVAQDFANNTLKDAYIGAEISAPEAVKLLEYLGHPKPEDTVTKWEFDIQNPEHKDASDAAKVAYSKVSSVDVNVFLTVWKIKSDEGKEATVQYIQSLKFTAAQKRAIWNAVKGGWKDKGTPWE